MLVHLDHNNVYFGVSCGMKVASIAEKGKKFYRFPSIQLLNFRKPVRLVLLFDTYQHIL